MESGAVLIYLADKTGKLLPKSGEGRYRVLEWLMWQMAGPGPMFGQVHHFVKYNKGRAPYAEERYLKEVHRLYGVLDRRLASADGRHGLRLDPSFELLVQPLDRIGNRYEDPGARSSGRDSFSPGLCVTIRDEGHREHDSFAESIALTGARFPAKTPSFRACWEPHRFK